MRSLSRSLARSLFIAQFIGDITNIYFRGRRFFLPLASRSIFFDRLARAYNSHLFARLSSPLPSNSRACLPRAPNYLLTRRE